MKLFLDDLRPAPDGFTLAKTAPEAIALLATGTVTHLSLDHDLGPTPEDGALCDTDPGTGYDVLLWLEAAVATRGFVPPENIKVHSSNAGARPKMEAAIEAIRRFAASLAGSP